jgi:hypothetical protein
VKAYDRIELDTAQKYLRQCNLFSENLWFSDHKEFIIDTLDYLKASRVENYNYLQQGNANAAIICETLNCSLLYDVRTEYCKIKGIKRDSIAILSYIDNAGLVFLNRHQIDIELLEQIMVRLYAELDLELHLDQNFTRLKKFGFRQVLLESHRGTK